MAPASKARPARRIARRGDWLPRLNAYLVAHRDARFGWGRSSPSMADCCTFAAGAVAAMTDFDPMEEFRGAYRSRTGAARALREIGEGTLEATMDVKFPPRPPAFALRGDLALAHGCLGVVIGAEALFIGEMLAASSGADEPDRQGMVRISRSGWMRCWGVG